MSRQVKLSAEGLLDRAERVLGIDDATGTSSTLARGAVVCLAYAVLLLLYHGVVLDETVAAAQIITGAVEYPPGHPHDAFYKQAYSLLYYVASALWLAAPSATLVSAVFDVLWTFLSTFVPFTLATVLGGGALWGYLAAAVTSLGAFLIFSGTYPMFVFPSFFSNGHSGAHVALLAVGLLLARQWRTAGFLLGVLPSLHAAMAAVTWPWAAAWLLWSSNRPSPDERRTLIPAAAVGLAICVIVFALTRMTDVAPALPPYDVTGDVNAIYHAFTSTADQHRHLFVVRSLAYLVNPVAFFALAFLLHRSAGSASQSSGPESLSVDKVRWLAGFGAMIWIGVYGAWLHRAMLGPMPRPLELLMAFRFSNFTAMLLIPMIAAVIGLALRDAAPPIAARARVLLATSMIVLAGLFVARRTRVDPILLISCLSFCLGLVLASAKEAAMKRPALVAVGMIAGSLALLRPGGWLSAYFVAMTAAFVLLIRVRTRRSRADVPAASTPHWPGARLALTATFAVVALVALKFRGFPERFVMTPDDRRVAEWLETNGKPGEPILPAMWPLVELQLKTGHPTLLHWETLYVITYSPHQAAVVEAMTRDLIGLDFRDSAAVAAKCGTEVRAWCPAIATIWSARSTAEWQVLGRKYGFRLIYVPNAGRLQLRSVLPGTEWTLYEIPE
jgi:hypothetical protein